MRRTEVLILKLGLISLADLIAEAGEFTSCFVLADENTARHCYPKIKNHLPQHILLTIPAGEQAKNLVACQQIWEGLSRHQADRKSLMLCLGGGMVTDLGGFCASVYKRGIPTIYMSTTLMGMADAAIGGKTGVDFLHAKNVLGSFSNPVAIYLFPDFLETLSREEQLSGYAEIVKHALLQGGASWKAVLDKGKEFHETTGLMDMIEDSVTYKLSIVNQDPYEANLRKILNLGHTVGHAIESWKLEKGQPVQHGFAVAAGLVIEGRISLKKEMLKKEELQKITSLMRALFPKIAFKLADIQPIARLALQDKKNTGGSINAVLLAGIGSPQLDMPVSLQEIEEGLSWYLSEF